MSLNNQPMVTNRLWSSSSLSVISDSDFSEYRSVPVFWEKNGNMDIVIVINWNDHASQVYFWFLIPNESQYAVSVQNFRAVVTACKSAL